MLHLKMGQGTDAVAQFQDEKLAFPESSPFMDFLLRNADGQQAGAAPATSSPPNPSRERTDMSRNLRLFLFTP
ncbi:hypothetical protein WJ978_29655 [Achromobacter xylosoxidans]